MKKDRRERRIETKKDWKALRKKGSFTEFWRKMLPPFPIVTRSKNYGKKF